MKFEFIITYAISAYHHDEVCFQKWVLYSSRMHKRPGLYNEASIKRPLLIPESGLSQTKKQPQYLIYVEI
jgi:hypothetical protein